MLKCAIIGVSGGRARGLAEAYQHVTHGKLAAISTRTEENLHAFGDTFDVDTRYLDYREMFEKEQPDLGTRQYPAKCATGSIRSRGKRRCTRCPRGKAHSNSGRGLACNQKLCSNRKNQNRDQSPTPLSPAQAAFAKYRTGWKNRRHPIYRSELWHEFGVSGHPRIASHRRLPSRGHPHKSNGTSLWHRQLGRHAQKTFRARPVHRRDRICRWPACPTHLGTLCPARNK